MIVVGIDPGLSGAVARLEADGRLTVKRDFKAHSDIASAVRDLVPLSHHVVIELVGAMPGQGVCSMFSFGESTGVAKGAVLMCGRDPVRVAPQKWQNHFRRKYDLAKIPFKEHTRALATRLFPSYAALFTRKKDHGSADAALIALWAQETLQKN